MDRAERLQDLRKKAGYSQEQLADLLGLSRQAVSKWEAKQGKPDIDNILKLTEIYHVSADYLLLGVESQRDASPAEKRETPREYRQAVRAIAVLAAAALITVLFIAALALLAKFVL